MNLDFYSFLNVSRHKKDIKRDFGALRYNCKYVSPANMTYTDNYFHQAEIFFLTHMDKISSEIYANILAQKELVGINFNALQLEECITQGLNSFLPIYREEMLYNVGGIGFRGIENEVEKLIDNLKREIKDRSRKYYLKYKKEIKKIQAKRWKIFWSILGFIGFPTFVYFLSFSYAYISHKISIQDSKLYMIMSRAK